MRRVTMILATPLAVVVLTSPAQATTSATGSSVAPVGSAALSSSAVSSSAVSSNAVSSNATLSSAGVSSVGPNAVTARAIVPRASATGRKGQRLTVTPTRGLAAFGQSVKVSGRGFSETVGIYVGLCVMPRPGAKPTPCGGGADQDGSSQASAWISSNPPPYGASLAKPYKRGGKFTVRIKVSPRIGSVDCRVVRCAIVARADHTRAHDRTWDVAVPVTFR